MKKILLIGELNQTVSNINKCLLEDFKVQNCEYSLDLAEGMVKVFAPDLVVICLTGASAAEGEILGFFSRKKQELPVVLIGGQEECQKYGEYIKMEQFSFIQRPVSKSELLWNCRERLQGGSGKQEWSVPMDEFAKKQILLVDDSALSLRSIKSVLDRKYDIVVAMSGEKALPLIKKKRPDLILLDYDMPGWDGKRTLEEIRADEEIAGTPVVFLTGVADKEHIAAVLRLNPAGYLLKPIKQDKLLEVIEKVIT